MDARGPERSLCSGGSSLCVDALEAGLVRAFSPALHQPLFPVRVQEHQTQR